MVTSAVATARTVVTAKMLRQPNCSVSKPPTKGPSDRPEYTAATLIPRALHSSRAGYTALSSATLVPNTMAPPKPCTALSTIAAAADGARVNSSEAAAKIQVPIMKIRFLPLRSAIFPMGTRNIAATSR